MYNRSGIPKHSFRFVKQLGTNAVCITLLHATNKGMNGQIIEYNGLWRDNVSVCLLLSLFHFSATCHSFPLTQEIVYTQVCVQHPVVVIACIGVPHAWAIND